MRTDRHKCSCAAAAPTNQLTPNRLVGPRNIAASPRPFRSQHNRNVTPPSSPYCSPSAMLEHRHVPDIVAAAPLQQPTLQCSHEPPCPPKSNLLERDP